jgi:hypothetical protein
MSVELSLRIKDYKKIMAWFELAFAGGKEITEDDHATFRKVSVMAMTLMEELEDEKKDNA